MNNSVQTRVLRAVYSTLRPITRLLIRFGITYSQFSEISKIAFVVEANREKDTNGRPLNASRISVKTGISRKEVRRIRQLKLGSARSAAWVDRCPHSLSYCIFGIRIRNTSMPLGLRFTCRCS